MSVLTKAKKPNKRPRCEAMNSRRLRCQFQGIQQHGPLWVCRCHAKQKRVIAA